MPTRLPLARTAYGQAGRINVTMTTASVPATSTPQGCVKSGSRSTARTPSAPTSIWLTAPVCGAKTSRSISGRSPHGSCAGAGRPSISPRDAAPALIATSALLMARWETMSPRKRPSRPCWSAAATTRSAATAACTSCRPCCISSKPASMAETTKRRRNDTRKFRRSPSSWAWRSYLPIIWRKPERGFSDP